MSGITEVRDRLRTELGALPRRVLIVEGPTDKEFLEALLTRKSGLAWQSNWMVGFAENKRHVAKLLALEPAWFGLVDRDESTAIEVARQMAALPGRLFVLPRFCMESYFVVPSELWALLEPGEQARVPGGATGFDAALTARLSDYLRHGALWQAINPLWARLRARGFNNALLDFGAALKTDAQIEAALRRWHSGLSPNAIMKLFRIKQHKARSAPRVDQLALWIHGKQFFGGVVAPEIRRLLGVGSISNDQILSKLQIRSPFPADLTAIWNSIGLP